MAGKAVNATLEIKKLDLDEHFQMREIPLNDEHVRDLKEAIEAKPGSLPRIEVWDVDGQLIVTDGRHTVAAHRLAGMKTIVATVRKGSLLDATLAAAKANHEHLGLKRTAADKRIAVNRLMDRLAECKMDWTDTKIADELHVSRGLVKEIRNTRPDPTSEQEIPLPRTGKDDREYKPKPKKEKPAGVDSGGWESTPWSEFLDIDPFVSSALKNSNIKTAGELLNRIKAGEKFGLPIDDIEKMKKACEQLKGAEPEPERKPREKKVGEQAGFDFNRVESAYGILARAPDDIGDVYKQEQMSAEAVECRRHINNFKVTWDRWKKRLQGA